MSDSGFDLRPSLLDFSLLPLIHPVVLLLRNSVEPDAELIDTQHIAGKGKIPCNVDECGPSNYLDESEPFNFGSLSPHQYIATE